MKTENMSDFDDVLAKIKKLKEETTNTLEIWEPKKINQGKEWADHLRNAGQNIAYRTLLLRDSMLLSGPMEDNMKNWLETEQALLPTLRFADDALKQQGLIEGIKNMMSLLSFKTLQQNQKMLLLYEKLDKVKKDEFKELRLLEKSKNQKTEATREKWEIIRERRWDVQWMIDEEAREKADPHSSRGMNYCSCLCHEMSNEPEVKCFVYCDECNEPCSDKGEIS
jgi:hypothetical protein